MIKRGEKPFLNHWALPGDLIQSKESIDEAVYRILKELTGLKNVFMEQVKTFGDVGRHPLGRVFTVSYFSLIKIRDYIRYDNLSVDLNRKNILARDEYTCQYCGISKKSLTIL